MATLTAGPMQSFLPRKEFIKRHSTPHQFILVTFNGADILRCSNFPPDLIAAFRKLFEEKGVFRFYSEDPELHVSEFTLGDKMWVGKSIRTERLVTDIFSVLLTHQFRYVTTLAYGRLTQDKQSLMFSRALQTPQQGGTSLLSPHSANGSIAGGSPRSNNNTPLPPTSPIRSATPNTNGIPPPSPRFPPSDAGTQAQQPPLMDLSKTTFALSLSSKTLRVIHAPRTSTPAILATVRSAWPRGVISESKPEDDTYEFKLKGYGFFSTSTFERDALFHIFTLLRALDQHGFSLITNVSFTTGIAKSRTKDLWIFEAQADQGSGSDDERRDSAMSSALDPGVAGIGAGGTPTLVVDSVSKHVRSASEPMKEKPVSAHVRGSTAPPATTTVTIEKTEKPSTFGRAGSLLRRKKEKEKENETENAQEGVPPSSYRKESKVSTYSTSSLPSPAPAYTAPVIGSQPFRESPESSKPNLLNRKDTYGTQATDDTEGPLTRSQYDFDYVAGAGGGTTESAHLYRPYSGQAIPGQTQQQQQQPQQSVTIYESDRSHSHSRSQHSAHGSQSHSAQGSQSHIPPAKKDTTHDLDDDEQILHGNAFRDTTYTDISRDVPITYKGGRSSTSNINTNTSSQSGRPGASARRRSTDDSQRTPEEEVYEREYGEEAIAHQRKHATIRGVVESSHVEDNMGRTSAWRKSEKPVVGVLEESDEEHQDITGMPVPSPHHHRQPYQHQYHSQSLGSSHRKQNSGGNQYHPPAEMQMPIPSILRPSPVPVPIPVKFANPDGSAPSMPVPSPHSHASPHHTTPSPHHSTPSPHHHHQSATFVYTYQPAPPPPGQDRTPSSATVLPPGGYPRTPPAMKDDRDPMSSAAVGPKTPPRSPTKQKTSSSAAASPSKPTRSGTTSERTAAKEDPPIPQVMSTYNPPAAGRISLAPIAKVRSLSPTKEREKEKEKEKAEKDKEESSGKGWVLVNVESTPTHSYAANPMDQQAHAPAIEPIDLRSPPLSPRNDAPNGTSSSNNGAMPSIAGATSAAATGVIPRKSVRKKPISPTAMNKKRASGGSFGKNGKDKKRGLFGGLFGRKNTTSRRRGGAAGAKNAEEDVAADVDESEVEDEGDGEGSAGRHSEKQRV